MGKPSIVIVSSELESSGTIASNLRDLIKDVEVEVKQSINDLDTYLLAEAYKKERKDIYFVIDPRIPDYTGFKGKNRYCDENLNDLNRGLDGILDEDNPVLREFRLDDSYSINRVLDMLYDRNQIKCIPKNEKEILKKYIMRNLSVIKCREERLKDELYGLGVLCHKSGSHDISTYNIGHNIAMQIKRWMEDDSVYLNKDDSFGGSVIKSGQKTTIHRSTLSNRKKGLESFLKKGSTLDGRYKIQDIIGRGNTGVIYKAFDTKKKEYVAIKCLKENIANDKSSLNMVKDEIIITNMFKGDDRIVQIKEIDLNGGEKKYFTTELIEGKALTDIIESYNNEGKMIDFETVYNYIWHITDILEAVHSKEIVNRDIKPDHIIVTKNGKFKLLDFGISKVVDEGVVVTGTPAYMSPEQIKGGDAYYKSDIYSLGVILYYMLTGNLPYSRNIKSLTSSEQIDSLKNLYEKGYSPVPLRTHRKDIPVGLVWLDTILRSLDVDTRFDATQLKRILNPNNTEDKEGNIRYDLNLDSVLDEFINLWDMRGYKLDHNNKEFKSMKKYAYHKMMETAHRPNLKDIIDIILGIDKPPEEPVIGIESKVPTFRRLFRK